MSVGRIFSRGCNSGFFQGWSKGFFQRVPSVVKFYFINSETKKKHFYTKPLLTKYQTSKSRGPCPPFPPFRRPCMQCCSCVINSRVRIRLWQVFQPGPCGPRILGGHEQTSARGLVSFDADCCKSRGHPCILSISEREPRTLKGCKTLN